MTKKTYKKKFVIEAVISSIPLETFFARIFSCNAAKQLASAALLAEETAAKDIEMKAIDMGKTMAIDAFKKLVEEAAKKLSTPISQVANVMLLPEEIS